MLFSKVFIFQRLVFLTSLYLIFIKSLETKVCQGRRRKRKTSRRMLITKGFVVSASVSYSANIFFKSLEPKFIKVREKERDDSDDETSFRMLFSKVFIFQRLVFVTSL